MTAPLSVAARVLLTLKERLSAIDGTGDFTFDVHGRVHMFRPSVDLIAEDPPRIYIARRLAGETREAVGSEVPQQLRTVIFDVYGAVFSQEDATDDCRGLAAEAMLADIERALELPADPFIRVGDDTFLLGKELTLVDPELSTGMVRAGVEIVAVGVSCAWPHYYGDPARL